MAWSSLRPALPTLPADVRRELIDAVQDGPVHYFVWWLINEHTQPQAILVPLWKEPDETQTLATAG